MHLRTIACALIDFKNPLVECVVHPNRGCIQDECDSAHSMNHSTCNQKKGFNISAQANFEKFSTSHENVACLAQNDISFACSKESLI
jgi:hypothetical protein